MEKAAPNITALVLAAGEASRMGGPKQLLSWRGTTFLENILDQINNSLVSRTLVVLGAHSGQITAQIEKREGAVLLYNEDWKSGLGSSIACGARYLTEKNISTDGLLILLADQPLVDHHYINTLIAGFAEGEKKMVATLYGHGMGVPALFSKDYIGALTQLRSDVGAKELIAKNRGHVLAIDPGEKSLDVDTRQQYKILLQKDKDQTNTD
ncbi:MAG: nucleotidyltransferase family protein [Sediminicola sp.]